MASYSSLRAAKRNWRDAGCEASPSIRGWPRTIAYMAWCAASLIRRFWMRRDGVRFGRILVVLSWFAALLPALAAGQTALRGPAQTAAPGPAQTASSAPPSSGTQKSFQDEDAARLMSQFRQALENENRNRFLKLFDSARMPSFPVFRDEVSQFLGRYQPPQIDYSIGQVSQDGALGAVVVEITLEAAPWTEGLPVLHRRTQMRVVASWDGKQWRIADLSPRDLFQ